MVVVTVRQVTSPLDCIRVEDPPLPMDPEPVPAGLERSHQPGGSLPAPPTHTASNTHRPAPAPTTCTLAPTGVYKLEVQAWEGECQGCKFHFLDLKGLYYLYCWVFLWSQASVFDLISLKQTLISTKMQNTRCHILK